MIIKGRKYILGQLKSRTGTKRELGILKKKPSVHVNSRNKKILHRFRIREMAYQNQLRYG